MKLRDTLAALLVLLSLTAQASEPTLAVPSKGQYIWHEQERIMFLCLDPCTWQEREYDNHSTDLKDIKLPKLDTDQWCETAQAWGAKEILFVAKHTGGFCWWHTDTSEYSVKNTAWKDGEGCLLDELARSCAKYDLNLGIYVYPGDDTWGAGISSGGATQDPSKQEAYNKVFREQLRETARIAKRHVDVVEFWFDGSCVIEVGDIMKEEAPDAVVFQGPHASIRWVGTEGGRMLYDQSWCSLKSEDLKSGLATAAHSTPDGDAWAPCEVNTTLYNHFWFWAKKNEAHRKSLDELVRIFYESVGQGAVMLLNSTPTTEGIIPADDVKLYTTFGNEIKRRFDHPLSETSGQGKEHILDLGKLQNVNHVIVMEDYRQGERIRKYLVEGWDGNAWKIITGGAHVGRKHINYFDDVTVSKLKLKVTESVGEPLIRDFSAYNVENFEKPAISHYKPFVASAADLKTEEKVQADWKHCMKWTADDFSDGAVELTVDLTGKLTIAGQWQVKFVPAGKQAALDFADAVLIQSGQASIEGVLVQSKEDSTLWNINRTAVVTDGSDNIQLKITLQGEPTAGEVFIKRQ